jgi:acetyltransferase-like isoleucine patch superfamily enzyme
VRKQIQGQGNLMQAEGAILANVALDIIGDDNHIVIGEGSVLYNVTFRIRGDRHRIEFGRNCRMIRGGLIWFEDCDGVLQVGQNTTMVDATIAVTEPGSKIVIGEECMFANDIDIRTGDSHSIIDANTGKRLNFAEDVNIGNRVWIASHVIVLKGVTIGENTIVATGSVVTRPCEAGAIVAGNPARVVKTGVSWKRERLPKGGI